MRKRGVEHVVIAENVEYAYQQYVRYYADKAVKLLEDYCVENIGEKVLFNTFVYVAQQVFLGTCVEPKDIVLVVNRFLNELEEDGIISKVKKAEVPERMRECFNDMPYPLYKIF